jgi:hypothetical protein
MTFGGFPTGDCFAKRYEPQYQSKKMEVDGAVLDAQFGCLNFHVKCYKNSGAKLTVAATNKWSLEWTKVWFYCKVWIHQSPHGGKNVYALCSHMSALDFLTEPPVDYIDTDVGDVAFVRATCVIGGRDAIEEYLACGQYPLSSDFGFGEIHDSITPVLKLSVPLLEFCAARAKEESKTQFLVKIELGQKTLWGAAAMLSMRPTSSCCLTAAT